MEKPEQIRRRFRTAATLALQMALAAALIVWMIRSGRLELRLLGRLQLHQAFGAIVLCRVMIISLQMIRWQRLVHALGLKLRPSQAVHIGLIGSFFGVVAPSFLGHDGARLYYGTRENAGQQHELLSSILVDRLIGLIALALMALAAGALLMVLRPHATLSNLLAVSAVVITGGACAIALAAWRYPRLLAAACRWRPVERVLAGIWHYRLRKRAIVEAVLLSWLSQSFLILSMWFAFVSLGVSPPAVVVCTITPLISLTSGIPLTPMGLGVTDAVGETLYHMMGVNEGAEAYLVVRLAMLLVAAVSAIAFLIPFRQRTRRTIPLSEDA